jgi:hypothetical protein
MPYANQSLEAQRTRLNAWREAKWHKDHPNGEIRRKRASSFADQSPKAKRARRRARAQTPKCKAARLMQQRNPEVRARRKAKRRVYHQTPERKAAMTVREQTPKVRAQHLASTHKMPIEIPNRPRPENCECCGGAPNKTLHFDHCHDTGRFRGWCCHGCNTGQVDGFIDSPRRLRLRALFLERPFQSGPINWAYPGKKRNRKSA